MTTRPATEADVLATKRQKIRHHAGNFFELMTLVDPEAIAKMKDIACNALLKPLAPQMSALKMQKGEEMKALTGTRSNATQIDREMEEQIEKVHRELARLIDARRENKANHEKRERELLSRVAILDTSLQALQGDVDKAVKIIDGTFTPADYSAADGLLALASSSPSSSSSSPEPSAREPLPVSKPAPEVIQIDQDSSSSFPSLEEPCAARPDYTIQNMEDEVILLPVTDRSPAPVVRSGRGNNLNELIDDTNTGKMAPPLAPERIRVEAMQSQHVKINRVSKKGIGRGWKATWCFRDGKGWGSVHPFLENDSDSYESAYQWAITDLAMAAAKNNGVLIYIKNENLEVRNIAQYIYPFLNSWQIVYVNGNVSTERYVQGRHFPFEKGNVQSKENCYEETAEYCARSGHTEPIPRPWRRLTRSQQRLFK